MKHVWRQKEKNIYLPTETPTIIQLPLMKYITLSGEGNPNSPGFSSHIEVLYTLSYAVRQLPKQGIHPPGYFEYTVYPLEGIWDMKPGKHFDLDNKDNLVYEIMIRQPDFVTEAVFHQGLEIAIQKNKIEKERLELAQFKEITEGKALQALHIGPFDEEYKTFETMEIYLNEHGLHRQSKTHKEIYLTNFQKTAPDKLKTVLRIWI